MIKKEKSPIDEIKNDEIGITTLEEQFVQLWIQAGIPSIEELGIDIEEFSNPNKNTLEKLRLYIKQLENKKDKTKQKTI